MNPRRERVLYRAALSGMVVSVIATIVWTAMDGSAWSVLPVGGGLLWFMLCSWLNFGELGQRVRIGWPRNRFLDRIGKDSR